MKYISLALLTLAAIGCGHNEFDVTPTQVSHRASLDRTKAEKLRLPAEVVKTDFKKGDRLPNGAIADHEVKMKISSDSH
jgi:hypothetical protein